MTVTENRLRSVFGPANFIFTISRPACEKLNETFPKKTLDFFQIYGIL